MKYALITILVVLVFSTPSLAAERCAMEIGRGEASWYGESFHGERTSSGEFFDASSFSAAHPDLPFGTMVKVLNLRNAKSVVVRINDRGNFGHRRVIDLSEMAASALDMIDHGTAAVALYRCD